MAYLLGAGSEVMAAQAARAQAENDARFRASAGANEGAVRLKLGRMAQAQAAADRDAQQFISMEQINAARERGQSQDALSKLKLGQDDRQFDLGLGLQRERAGSDDVFRNLKLGQDDRQFNVQAGNEGRKIDQAGKYNEMLGGRWNAETQIEREKMERARNTPEAIMGDMVSKALRGAGDGVSPMMPDGSGGRGAAGVPGQEAPLVTMEDFQPKQPSPFDGLTIGPRKAAPMDPNDPMSKLDLGARGPGAGVGGMSPEVMDLFAMYRGQPLAADRELQRKRAQAEMDYTTTRRNREDAEYQREQSGALKPADLRKFNSDARTNVAHGIQKFMTEDGMTFEEAGAKAAALVNFSNKNMPGYMPVDYNELKEAFGESTGTSPKALNSIAQRVSGTNAPEMMQQFYNEQALNRNVKLKAAKPYGMQTFESYLPIANPALGIANNAFNQLMGREALTVEPKTLEEQLTRNMRLDEVDPTILKKLMEKTRATEAQAQGLRRLVNPNQ